MPPNRVSEASRELVEELLQERIALNEQLNVVDQQINALGGSTLNYGVRLPAKSARQSTQSAVGRAQYSLRSDQSPPRSSRRPSDDADVEHGSRDSAATPIDRRSWTCARSSIRRPPNTPNWPGTTRSRRPSPPWPRSPSRPRSSARLAGSTRRSSCSSRPRNPC